MGPGAAQGSGSGPGRPWAGLERGRTPGEPVKAWFEGLRKENKGYLNDMAFPSDRILTTVDFAVRGRNGLIVKQLYLNDIPWVEAIELMRKGKFPLLEEPIDRNSSFPRFRRIRIMKR